MGVHPVGIDTLDALIQASPAAVIVLDGDLRIHAWNRGAEQLFGWRADEVRGQPAPLVPDGGAVLAAARRGEPVASVVARWPRRDGSLVELSTSALPLLGDDGRLAWVLVALTESVQPAEAAAEAPYAEPALADLLDLAAVPMHWVAADGTVLRVNQAELDLLGYARDEVVGHPVAEFHADRGAIDALIGSLTAGGTVRDHPARLRRKDGAIRDVLISASGLWRDGRFVHGHCVTRDITREHADRVAASRLAAIVLSSYDAIVGKTLDGTITAWNPTAERLFGWSAAEALGQHINLIVPPERRAEEAAVLATIRRGELIEHFDTVRMARDGRRVEVSLTISPIRDGAGRIVGASKIARDITERRRAEEMRARALESEQRARAAAEALNRTKDEFLATLSHELRTPLTAIVGWARLLQRGGLDEPTTARAIDAIAKNAAAQARLVDDLLDLSRIATGQLRLEPEPMDLRAVVEAALETLRPAATAKGIALRATMPEPVPMQGAPDRLQQVVWNLLSNAVKFTPSGGCVEVQLRAATGRAELVIADTGQGIDPAMLPHVFDQFWQEDSSTTRAHGGLGLGLSLVRRLVELHGGEVRADSAGRGKGATFTVTLPTLG